MPCACPQWVAAAGRVGGVPNLAGQGSPPTSPHTHSHTLPTLPAPSWRTRVKCCSVSRPSACRDAGGGRQQGPCGAFWPPGILGLPDPVHMLLLAARLAQPHLSTPTATKAPANTHLRCRPQRRPGAVGRLVRLHRRHLAAKAGPQVVLAAAAAALVPHALQRAPHSLGVPQAPGGGAAQRRRSLGLRLLGHIHLAGTAESSGRVSGGRVGRRQRAESGRLALPLCTGCQGNFTQGRRAQPPCSQLNSPAAS